MQGLCSNGTIKYPLLRTLNTALSKKEKGEEPEPEEEVGEQYLLVLKKKMTVHNKPFCRHATPRTTPTQCQYQPPRTLATALVLVWPNQGMHTQHQLHLSPLEPPLSVSSLTNQTLTLPTARR